MQEKGDRKYWYIFSIADVIFITIFIGILTSNGKLLNDPDLGYHIKTGEYIMENLTVPTHDIFTHTIPPLPWTAHEWLAGLIFAIVYKPLGLTGVYVLVAILIALIYMILFKFLRSLNISMLVALLITLLAACSSAVHWLARPHIFALLLFLIWYVILDIYQYKHKNYLYLLPILMLLWVNIHGSFILGLVLLSIYIIGNILKVRFALQDSAGAYQKAKVLFLFLFICLMATILNPQGFKILLFPINFATDRAIIDYISESMSPDFHNFLFFEYMLFLMMLILAISVKRLNIIEIILVLSFTYLSLFAARNIPLYAIIISPIIAKQITGIIKEFKGNKLLREIISISDQMAEADSKTKWNLWAILAIVVVIIMSLSGKINYRFDEKKIPVDAVQFLRNEKLKGNMFNNDDFGDYIIYAAWPEYDVFIDGRFDMYGGKKMAEYGRVIGIRNGWNDVLIKYDISWIIYNNGSALSNLLLASPDWKLIYSDIVANIFVKNIPENQQIINKYPNLRPVTGD